MDQTPKQTGSRRAVPNKTQAAPTDSEEYEVEKVLSKKVIDGTVQYLIKWKEEEGGEKWENSWEPVENLVNALAKVRLYEEGELEARKKQVASTSSAGSVSGQTKRKASTSAGPSGQTNQQKKTKCEQKRMELIKSKTLVKNVVAIHRKEGDKDETEKIVVHFENEMMIFVSFDELKLMSAANIKKVKEEINTWNECFVQNPTCDDEDDDDSDNDEDGDGKDGSAGGAGPSGTSASASSSHLSKKAKLS